MSAVIYPLAHACRPWRWGLVISYNPALIAAIKHNIPSRQRRWRGELKQWWIRDEAMPALLALCTQHCGSVRHLEANAAMILAYADHGRRS